MRQILFTIPLHDWTGLGFLPNIPLYGYGMMLFFAFIGCYLLSRRMCKKEGIDGDLMLDLIICLFVTGIIGGRITFVLTEWDKFVAIPWTAWNDNPIYRMVALWDGGLVFYGAIFGGTLGYLGYHYLRFRPLGISVWKMLDVAAPCLALGAALGRVGCLFTGCCFGNVACAECPAIHFPLTSEPTAEMIRRGYQTPLGFSLKDRSPQVQIVEPGSAAAAAGLQPGDIILDVNGFPLEEFGRHLRDVKNGSLKMEVMRGRAVRILEFEPRSIGLNPTQTYETISMVLLLFIMLSYFPFRKWDGELMVIFMFGYAVHRFVNEMLRTDTEKVAFNMTLSQNISILVVAVGIVVAFLVYRRPRITTTAANLSPLPA